MDMTDIVTKWTYEFRTGRRQSMVVVPAEQSQEYQDYLLEQYKLGGVFAWTRVPHTTSHTSFIITHV